MPRSKKADTTAESKKPVTFKSLAALKTAKSRKTAPRGVKASFSLNGDEVWFNIPSQIEPILKISLADYVTSALKGDGFTLA